MIRFAWLTTASAVLLTACGGGISSPDFQGNLVGIDIIYPGSTASTPAKAEVVPGATFKFDAVGLYSTPPGTKRSTGLVTCDGSAATDDSTYCRQGPISGVSWVIDTSATGTSGPVATIDSNGLATGVRRGSATVRARANNLEDKTVPFTVDGPVMSSIRIDSLDAKNNVPNATSVPTGRSFVLTGVATCESGFGADAATNPNRPNSNATCTNQDYQYSWSLPTTTDPATVEFNPTNATGESISVKTKRFGPFQIIAKYVNEEGVQKQQTINLNASERVLDDIVIAADPVEAAPVGVLIGAKTRFVASGVFSDGSTDVIRAGDLKTALAWTADSAAVGKITIECGTTDGSCAGAPSPNSAVLVSGSTIGSTGLTAKSSNVETTIPGKPNGLELEDRIAIQVKTLGLLKLVDICPFNSVGGECRQNVQLPVGTTTKFKARGSFQDNPNVPRDIDPSKIGLTWSKTVTASSGDVTVVAGGSTGEFTATKQGTVGLNVAITDFNVEPSATPRQVSTTATVVEAVCRDQLLTPAASGSGSSSSVTNVGNVIDTNADSFGNVTVTAGLLGSEESMTFQRTGTTVTPGAGGQSVGFLIAHEDVFNPEASSRIETLNAAGTIVQTFNDPTASTLSVPARNAGADALVALKATATLPFTGVRLVIEVPDPSASPTGTPLDLLLGPLLSLLGLGGSTDIHAYAACADLP